MEIFLLRHFESEKNIQNIMSYNDNEPLTLRGKKECYEFTEYFKSFCMKRNIFIDMISSANSIRAKETADIISSEFGNIKINSYCDFKSTQAGNLAGKSLQDIRIQDPFFSKYYSLYRKGLLNLYFMDENWHDKKKESKKTYEKRVMNCFYKIVNDSENKDILIVGHRASITAILINVARKMGIYPKDYYGHIELSLGKISWLSLSDKDIWQINCVNTKIEEIK